MDETRGFPEERRINRHVVGNARVLQERKERIHLGPNVFDLWIEAWRKKVAVGEVIVVRYADDLVVGFESRAEAERFLSEFRERLAKFTAWNGMRKRCG